MKKYIFFLLCLIMILSLISCDINNNHEDLSSNENGGLSDVNDDSTNDDNITPSVSENEKAIQMYEAAINDEICVIDEHLGEIKLKACRFPSNNSRLDESIIDGKVVLDMDGDGICEYIIFSASMDGLVLHYFNGKVYSFSFYFYNVNTDGSFYWDDSSVTGCYSYGANKLHFDGELLKIEEIYKVVNDGESNVEYYIDGKQVTHNEFLKYIEDNPNTPVEFTSFTAPWQEVIPLERALEIASEYWYECYNIKAGDVDSETGFPFAFLPKNSNNENYSIALAWLVEGSHYSTLEMIEIDAFTGEIIVPTYEPDGKG